MRSETTIPRDSAPMPPAPAAAPASTDPAATAPGAPAALPLTYIVRLYRSEPQRPLIGTVERADENVVRGFRTAAELIALLKPVAPVTRASDASRDAGSGGRAR
jgi:hypothetical protein